MEREEEVREGRHSCMRSSLVWLELLSKFQLICASMRQ